MADRTIEARTRNHLSTFGVLVALTPSFSSGAVARDAVIILENAHLNHSGRGLACDRGYRKSGDLCVAIDVPAHTDLRHFGNVSGLVNSGCICTLSRHPGKHKKLLG